MVRHSYPYCFHTKEKITKKEKGMRRSVEMIDELSVQQPDCRYSAFGKSEPIEMSVRLNDRELRNSGYHNYNNS